MPEPTLTFTYLSHTERGDGMIASYAIGVTYIPTQVVEVIPVETQDLASAKDMAITLQGRNLFYRTTQQVHDQIAGIVNLVYLNSIHKLNETKKPYERRH